MMRLLYVSTTADNTADNWILQVKELLEQTDSTDL